ncbi:aldehyde ferredoxin oxidoreductase C-terminal domain-containing protein [Thermodesulforhabdus norvegica]|uniref:Aldehyde:ferredoxin oxidoreductase n=1 Tax=Thermodesulforhabdus norvegica TaxID=39841 RepID=A0A1I4VWN4_9BACT|nr:aldehyde ferredoxin oxidoreductase C-terminal domain-containing protein [Thermodesulforhabdus norvegica]SFN05738.1 aldehyde:ferredoxin oxidoreductase [Thermodesulforhabdus norvegica]
MEKILRVNSRTGSWKIEVCDGEIGRLGGRALIAHVLLNEVVPTCDPLGRKNKLIVACGLLGDTPVTTAGRFSLGGKSPLTMGVKEANVGGAAGKALARLGFRAVIVEDAPRSYSPRVLYINRSGVELFEVRDLLRASVSDTCGYLRARFGDQIGILCIGPAGEMGMCAAGIATTDHTGVQIRYAARGGLGALMGSKGIKAMVFDPKDAPNPVFYDSVALNRANKELVRLLMEDPKTENRHNFGTPAVLSLCNELGILPTRNFRSGSFEGALKICGETIAMLIDKRGGDARKGTPCVKGCVIRCSNVFADAAGKEIVASIQYENIALLGSNLGIGDIDKVAELNRLCNEIGLDAIETGAAIGVAMEAGILDFGDAEAAKELLHEVRKGTPLGRIIGNGAAVTGRVFNVRRVPVIKGQGIPAYDPRSLKGIGVTYATSPMGADHTAGNALETASTVDPRSSANQPEVSRRLQLRAAILDSLGVCLFIRPAFVKKPELIAELLNARYGWNWTYKDVRNFAVECLQKEKTFNERAGIIEPADVPEFMREEPLPPYNTVFDVSPDELKRTWVADPPEDVF